MPNVNALKAELYKAIGRTFSKQLKIVEIYLSLQLTRSSKIYASSTELRLNLAQQMRCK